MTTNPAGNQPYRPRPTGPTANPRRVRGGVRPVSRDPAQPSGWLGRAWVGLMGACASAEAAEEGLDYAKRGQTRRLEVEPGVVRGQVQGRVEGAYRASIAVGRFTVEEWDGVVDALSGQAMFAAKLLAGELPASVEDVVRPLGVSLAPSAEPAGAVRTDCSCGGGTWCKHTCCLAYLIADRLDREPLLAFALRGLPGEEVLERVRQRRQSRGEGGAAMPVYLAHVPGAEDLGPQALEACVDRFWEAGPELDGIDFPLEPPAVSHPLLRRLGPSPFKESRFPMVGLLATCYEVIGRDAVEEQEMANGT